MERNRLAYAVVALSTFAACGCARQMAGPAVSQLACAPANAPPSAAGSAGGAERRPFTIDLRANPNMQFRVDSFSVPDTSRGEFEARMRENAAFLANLPGFMGHVVFEMTSGPTTVNIVTLAAWESPEAMKDAGEKVRADYQRTGFDMQATIARWGVTASIGSYRAPLALQ